jgi:Mg-chelatase subunit ChlI
MKIPMVDLPLGATEDRVCGTIDIEKARARKLWPRIDRALAVH